MEDGWKIKNWPRTLIQIKKQFERKKRSLLLHNKQLWISIIIAIVNIIYFSLYVFSSNLKLGNVKLVDSLCILAIIVLIVLLSMFPTIIRKLGTWLSITYLVNLIFSIWYLILCFIIAIWKSLDKVQLRYIVIPDIVLTIFFTAVLMVIYFEYIEDSTFLSVLSVGSSIIIFSTPIVFSVVRSQTLAVATGSFIAFITHFFFKKVVPYMFSSLNAEEKNLSKIELVYELNSTGKILVGLIDILFAYVVFAYSIAMHFATQQLVNIKLKTGGEVYKNALEVTKKLYGRHIHVTMDSGTVYYWSQKADNIFLNTFTAIILVELVLSIAIFWGLYKNLDKSVLKSIVRNTQEDNEVDQKKRKDEDNKAN